MRLNEYQDEAAKTAIYPTGGLVGVTYCALKINGEAGEIAEKLGKLMRDHNGDISLVDRHALCKEIGDVLWYASQLARELGLTLEEVAAENLKKLASRKERGKLGGSGDER